MGCGLGSGWANSPHGPHDDDPQEVGLAGIEPATSALSGRSTKSRSVPMCPETVPIPLLIGPPSLSVRLIGTPRDGLGPIVGTELGLIRGHSDGSSAAVPTVPGCPNNVSRSRSSQSLVRLTTLKPNRTTLPPRVESDHGTTAVDATPRHRSAGTFWSCDGVRLSTRSHCSIRRLRQRLIHERHVGVGRSGLDTNPGHRTAASFPHGDGF